MSIYLIAIALACYLLGVAPAVLYDIQMLQLHSYRNTRYLRWMRQKSARFLHARQLLGLLPLALLPLGSLAVLVGWCVVYAALFATRQRTVQKKKLVITSRVTRLLVFHALVLAGLAGVSFLASDAAPLITLALLASLSPLILLVSNLAAQPLEWLVGRFYYHDAKRILARHRDLTVIGITGSYGKTSTKLVVQQLLSTRFNALATPQSYNTPMGVIRAIRTLLRPLHDVFVAEMGACQAGDIKELCDLVEPKIGILTAIGAQHLETFHSIDAIAKTKLELFVALPADGLACYNADDAILCQTTKRPQGPRYISYAIDAADASYRALDVTSSAKGTEFTVTTPKGERCHFRTRLLGRHNVYNILAGIAVSGEMGIPLQTLVPAVSALPPAPHRLEAKRTDNGVTILDDAFSANPMGAKYALEVLAALAGERKILVTPGMVELGVREFELNKAFGAQAAQACDYVILVGPQRTVPIQAGLVEAGYPPRMVYVAADLKEAQGHLHTLLRHGDVVLYENDLPDTYNEAKA